MAKVAIITRTQNRPILLKRAIESVLGQVFQDWEMVIVNDAGEKEPVEKLVAEYEDKAQKRIRVLHREKSSGMEAASNAGLKSSQSQYVVIHDDDDSWHSDFLQKCMQFFSHNRDPRFKGLVTRCTKLVENIEGDQVNIVSREPYNPDLYWVNLCEMLIVNRFPPISFVYEKTVLDDIGYYDEKLPVLGDWDFNLRFLQKYNIWVIHGELANYHHRDLADTGSYGNSVSAGETKHCAYDALIRNEWLRRDIENRTLGYGFIMNFWGNIYNFKPEVMNKLANMEGVLHNLDNYLYKPIVTTNKLPFIRRILSRLNS